MGHLVKTFRLDVGVFDVRGHIQIMRQVTIFVQIERLYRLASRKQQAAYEKPGAEAFESSAHRRLSS